MIDSSERTFARDVLDVSREALVLVDFWAPWCGPCRALGPLLERLEQSYAGRFRLVKVNSDENPALAAQFQVRSIPYVVAVSEGKIVDSFVGALPEGQLRQFIDRLLPNPSEIERRKGHALAAAGDLAGAVSALRAAIALDPHNDRARLDCVELLLHQSGDGASETALSEAHSLLAAVTAAGRVEVRFTALSSQLDSLEASRGLPGEGELQARVGADPNDLHARLDLANLHIARRRYEAALDELLEIVARDRAFEDDVGRKKMLAVFDLLADQPQTVAQYRRRLSSLLNR
jgi:putative thioredoxin